MLALFSYLRFLLKSTNQHGVHSPFVYNFVTKCLYNKQLIPKKELKHSFTTLSNLQMRLLLKIIRYFSAYHILTDDISIKIFLISTLAAVLVPQAVGILLTLFLSITLMRMPI